MKRPLLFLENGKYPVLGFLYIYFNNDGITKFVHELEMIMERSRGSALRNYIIRRWLLMIPTILDALRGNSLFFSVNIIRINGVNLQSECKLRLLINSNKFDVCKTL